jgi:hypothetical protein
VRCRSTKNTIKHRSSTVAVLIILVCVVFFEKCVNNQTDKAVSNAVAASFNDYAGDASCANCHRDIYQTHIKTAHFHTSEIATRKSIKGSFDPYKNRFLFNTGGEMVMENKDDSFFQTAYVNGVVKKSEPFDIVIGSGKKGQSYLSWIHNNRLVQLPMTYFTDSAQWCTSPGYPDRIAAFNRPITSRCLECHTTYVERLSEPDKDPELFDKNKMILGIGCEKCHGPAAKHVEFQTQNPAVKTAKYIINPARFTRQQSLDMCALCHGGRLQKSKPSFSFIAGDNLADYFTMDTVKNNFSYVDVHGNQLGLLIASKCFRMSATLTCITCHNSHNSEQDQEALFSKRCQTCHNNSHGGSVTCKMTAQLGDEIKNKCVSCHMPLQKSLAISVLLQGYTRLTQASMHTHLIKVYPDETQMVLNFIKHK